MTNKEAIEELKKDYDLYYSEGVCWADDGTPDGKLLKALEMAISALEKQIPKKVKWDENNAYCPVCNGLVFYADDDCCSSCGQMLDWREYEDA